MKAKLFIRARAGWIASGLLACIGLALAAWLVLRPAIERANGALEKVTIGDPTQPGAGLLYVAAARGYFKETGLEVTLLPFTTGKAALDAALEGRADAALVAETPFVLATLAGRQPMLLATVFRARDYQGLVGRIDRGVRGPADLKGKKIAVTLRTSGEFVLDSMLAANGLSRADIEALDTRPEEMRDALGSGRVDAAVTWHPHIPSVERALAEGLAVTFAAGMSSVMFNLAASAAFVKERSAAAERLVSALMRAADFVRS